MTEIRTRLREQVQELRKTGEATVTDVLRQMGSNSSLAS